MTLLRSLILVCSLSLVGAMAPPPAMSQGISGQNPSRDARIPNQEQLEVLIKQALSMLNDANIADNYTVFHARIAPNFRRQYTVERIAAAFKVFRDRAIDFGLVVAYRPEITEGPAIDSDGVLKLKGVFPTEPSRVFFDLSFMDTNGKWLILGIHVNVKPKDD